MADLVEQNRGGTIDPPRLLPPMPVNPGPAGGWLTEPPPEGPCVIGMWSAACYYCRKGLQDLVPLAAELGLPFVALHVPEFPDDALPGAPEKALEGIGLPIGRPGVHHHRDATAWAELVMMRFWPTFLVVDADRRATFRLIGWGGHDDPLYGGLQRAMEAARRTASS